jgi:hypothetical protein
MNDTVIYFDVSSQYACAKGVYHIAFFHPVESPAHDKISGFLLDFVNGREPQTTQWIRLAAMAVSQAAAFDVVLMQGTAKAGRPAGTSPIERLSAAVARKTGPRLCRDLASAFPKGTGGSKRILLADVYLPDHDSIQRTVDWITNEVPEAEVSFVALATNDEEGSNGHLDEKYFASAASPPSPGRATQTATTAGTSRSSACAATVPAPAVAKARTGSPVGGPPFGTMVLMLGVVAVLLFSAFMLFAKKPAPVNPPAVYALPQVSEVPARPPPVVHESPPAPAKEPKLPKGIIAVPSVGLRANHSLESKAVRCSVRGGEVVGIVKRFSPDDGPSWLHVKTKSGATGWLWASLVREHRSGKSARR